MCTSPITIDGQELRCRQCKECRIQRSSEWAFRATQEYKYATSGVFLTLTYDEQNVPWIDSKEGPIQTLDKSDLQKFIKRVRKRDYRHKKNQFNYKIRYMSCGEYGPTTGRPHYHMLLFNAHKKTIKEIEKCWKIGFVVIGDVEPKSIHYVTDYIQKERWKRVPPQSKEFNTFSTGFGSQYISDYQEYHERTKTHLMKTPSKKERPLLKYYETKLYSGDALEQSKKKRIEMFQKLVDERTKEALEKEPLDPIGYLKTQNKKKIQRLDEQVENRKKRII